jgi:ABC-type Fe3+/spermidine/putrescine transport system ATPase subunit
MEVYTRPADRFVADFVGIANFLPGTVRQATAEGIVVESPLGLLTAQPRPDVQEGHRVTLLLRPEALRLASAPGGGGLAARIRSTSFLGGTRRHRVQVGELELIVDEAFSDPAEAPGREAWLTVDASRLHLLPAETA